MIAEKIINDNKRTDTGEIIVTLFELCDLNCLFCSQDHNSVLGIDTIVEKFDQIKQVIDKLKTTKNKKSFSLNIMGGEVFSDQLSDIVFEDYRTLIRLIQNYSKESNIDIDIRFATNFVFNKKERVHKLVADTGITLGTSYDPSGRFNKTTLVTFQDNVREFTPYINGVNVIMTKPNMECFVKDQVPFFDYLYEHFYVYFDHYTPERNMDFLLPKDVELRDFMKYMLDHWPNSFPFKNYPVKTKSNMTCMDTYTIMPDSNFGSCSILLKGVIPIKLIPSKVELEENWFDQYDCLSCEHFSRCSMGCFLSNHIKNGRTQNECWLKEVYNYVDSKGQQQ
jgi:hypothetical protein